MLWMKLYEWLEMFFSHIKKKINENQTIWCDMSLMRIITIYFIILSRSWWRSHVRVKTFSNWCTPMCPQIFPKIINNYGPVHCAFWMETSAQTVQSPVGTYGPPPSSSNSMPINLHRTLTDRPNMNGVVPCTMCGMFAYSKPLSNTTRALITIYMLPGIGRHFDRI